MQNVNLLKKYGLTFKNIQGIMCIVHNIGNCETLENAY